MKKYTTYIFLFLLSIFSLQAQDLSKKDVPSVILNNFQNAFPNACDIEWEKKGEKYKVEFEIGHRNEDRSAWYDNEGQLLKLQQEISKKDLPEVISDNINKDYRWYIITDAERVTEGEEITYRVEVRSLTKEWEILYSQSGRVISKKRD